MFLGEGLKCFYLMDIFTYLFQSRCSDQSEQIRQLQEELASAQKKLQVVDLA